MPTRRLSKNFAKVFLFVAVCGLAIATGAVLFLHDVLHIECGALHLLLVYVISLPLMMLVYWLGLKIWPRSKNDDTPT